MMRLRTYIQKILLVFTIGVAAALLHPAKAAEFAARFGEHDSFGRVVLEGPGIASMPFQSNNGLVSLTVPQASQLNFSGLPSELERWVESIVIEEDRILFSLLPNTQAKRSSWNDDILLIDFRSTATVGQQPDLPDILTRTGKHSNYARLVLESPQSFEVDFGQSGAVFSIRADRPVRYLDNEGLDRLSPFITGAKSTDKGLDLTLSADALMVRSESLSERQLYFDFGYKAEAATPTVPTVGGPTRAKDNGAPKDQIAAQRVEQDSGPIATDNQLEWRTEEQSDRPLNVGLIEAADANSAELDDESSDTSHAKNHEGLEEYKSSAGSQTKANGADDEEKNVAKEIKSPGLDIDDSQKGNEKKTASEQPMDAGIGETDGTVDSQKQPADNVASRLPDLTASEDFVGSGSRASKANDEPALQTHPHIGKPFVLSLKVAGYGKCFIDRVRNRH